MTTETVSLIIVAALIVVPIFLLIHKKKKHQPLVVDYVQEYSVLVDSANKSLKYYYEVYRRVMVSQYLDDLDALEVQSHNKDFESLRDDLQIHLDSLANAINNSNDKLYHREKAYSENIILRIENIITRLKQINYNSQVRQEQAGRKNQRGQTPNTERIINTQSGYFCSCRTVSDVKKKYRELAKIYHPDMPNGNKEIFQMIQREYAERVESNEK